MLFFVNRTKYLKDGGYKSSEEMVYTEQQKAEAKFHDNLAKDMVDETLSGSRCIVTNSEGGLVANKKWGTLIEEPQTEAE